jgi:hypothetical protein
VIGAAESCEGCGVCGAAVVKDILAAYAHISPHMRREYGTQELGGERRSQRWPRPLRSPALQNHLVARRPPSINDNRSAGGESDGREIK